MVETRWEHFPHGADLGVRGIGPTREPAFEQAALALVAAAADLHEIEPRAEDAPGAYKNVRAVVDAAAGAGLARKVARLVPIICIKG